MSNENSMTEEIQSNGLYLSIIGGTLREKVDENTPGAVRREWKLKDGTSGVKFEKLHKNLNGFIVGMEFKDGDFGEQFILTLKKGDNRAIVYMPTDSAYYTDFAKKLPNIHLDDDITFNPYEMSRKGTDKKRRGVSILQEGIKITSFYYDYEKKKAINKIPVPKGDTSKYNSDQWKMFFLEEKMFLKKEVESVIKTLPDMIAVSPDKAENIEVIDADNVDPADIDSVDDIQF